MLTLREVYLISHALNLGIAALEKSGAAPSDLAGMKELQDEKFFLYKDIDEIRAIIDSNLDNRKQ